MNDVCRRCLTAFSSQPVLIDHIDRCTNQKFSKLKFSWKQHLMFEDHHMKVPLSVRVYANLECKIQPRNTKSTQSAYLAFSDPEVLFKRITMSVG